MLTGMVHSKLLYKGLLYYKARCVTIAPHRCCIATADCRVVAVVVVAVVIVAVVVVAVCAAVVAAVAAVITAVVAVIVATVATVVVVESLEESELQRCPWRRLAITPAAAVMGAAAVAFGTCVAMMLVVGRSAGWQSCRCGLSSAPGDAGFVLFAAYKTVTSLPGRSGQGRWNGGDKPNPTVKGEKRDVYRRAGLARRRCSCRRGEADLSWATRKGPSRVTQVEGTHRVKGLPAHRAQGQGTGSWWNVLEGTRTSEKHRAQGMTSYRATSYRSRDRVYAGSGHSHESQVTGHMRATRYRKACTSQYKSQSGFTDRARESRASPKVARRRQHDELDNHQPPLPPTGPCHRQRQDDVNNSNDADSDDNSDDDNSDDDTDNNDKTMTTGHENNWT
ncbi:hypothetical protein EDB85DRAFT_1890597 [Lactarius pseudohatsudake]|nr:hypothetical protein EDB85DRAFT_1890597 [Lactarius pseudohatsudake]